MVLVLTQQFENKVKLLFHRGARKERSARHHLVEDTADAPGSRNRGRGARWGRPRKKRRASAALRTTCRCGWSSRCCPARCPEVGTTASPPRWSRSWLGWTLPGPSLKQVRRTSVLHRHERRTGGADPWSVEPTEVGQFQLSALVDQQVLGLQVAVENFPPVAVGQTAKQLEEKQLQGERRKNGVRKRGWNSQPLQEVWGGPGLRLGIR